MHSHRRLRLPACLPLAPASSPPGSVMEGCGTQPAVAGGGAGMAQSPPDCPASEKSAPHVLEDYVVASGRAVGDAGRIEGVGPGRRARGTARERPRDRQCLHIRRGQLRPSLLPGCHPRRLPANSQLAAGAKESQQPTQLPETTESRQPRRSPQGRGNP